MKRSLLMFGGILGLAILLIGGVSSAQNGKDFSFAVIGDTQSFGDNGRPLRDAVRNISAADPALVLAVGDLVNGCDGRLKCEAKLENWKDILGPLFGKTYPVMGNHDRTGNGRADALWQRFFLLPDNGPEGYSELVYSFDVGEAHFVGLNSEKPKEHIVNETQRAWLENDLSANRKKHVFVYFHEPAYPTNHKIGESLDAKPKERDALWDILARHKVTAVFVGHEHIHSRRQVDGVYQFGVGNTNAYDHEAPLPGMAEFSYVGFHYLLVEVAGDTVTVKVHAVDGRLIDTFVVPRF